MCVLCLWVRGCVRAGVCALPAVLSTRGELGTGALGPGAAVNPLPTRVRLPASLQPVQVSTGARHTLVLCRVTGHGSDEAPGLGARLGEEPPERAASPGPHGPSVVVAVWGAPSSVPLGTPPAVAEPDPPLAPAGGEAAASAVDDHDGAAGRVAVDRGAAGGPGDGPASALLGLSPVLEARRVPGAATGPLPSLQRQQQQQQQQRWNPAHLPSLVVLPGNVHDWDTVSQVGGRGESPP